MTKMIKTLVSINKPSLDELKHFGILGQKWGVRRFKNADGSLTSAGKKKDLKEVNKEISKRSTDIYIDANNHAASKINGKWLDDFNKKWSKAFEGYENWQDSPKYSKYENAYIKNLDSLMKEHVSQNPKSTFTTKLGSTFVARFMEEHGNIVWATSKEWEQHDKK